MVAMAYDGALRREELVQIEIDDIEPAHALIHLRAETTKSKRARDVAFGSATGQLLVSYFRERSRLFGRVNGRLLLSTSPRNRGAPIGLWSWTKIVDALAERAGVPRFSTHTFRHLRLTDLARADWTVDQIAQYAGHRDLSTTMLYIHLSGRELAARFQHSMSSIHREREHLLATLVSP
jgi:integrase